MTRCSLPPKILVRHGNVRLAIDAMFINNNLFLITNSQNLHFETAAELIKDTRQATIINSSYKSDHSRGLKIHVILGDGLFEHMGKRNKY